MNAKEKNLHRLFNPETVAVVGASNNPSKLGFHVMKSLVTGGFAGNILPINPKGREIFGIPTLPSLHEIHQTADLVIVVVPAPHVPDVFRACAETKAGGIVLITAGFREIEDPNGSRLHDEIKAIADKAAVPVIGPNTFGIVNYATHLNATFTPEFSQNPRGGIACVSQSGGIAHLLSFLAMRENVGFSKIIGLGNRLNIDFPEAFSHLAEDDATRVLMCYVEGVDTPKRMMAALRGLGKKKRVVVYKTGRSRMGDRASLSHTGSLAGNHEVYLGAFRQSGVLTVDSAEELLDTAKALDRCPFPAGNRVSVLSAQAGPGIAATDTCAEVGLALATFRAETQAQVNACLPPLALRTNPVDMGPAWYNADALSRLIRAVMEDPGVDGVLLLTMFASANAAIVEGMRETLLRWHQRKPVITCILAPEGIWDSEVYDLEERGAIVNYPTPERAARAFANLYKSGKLGRKQREIHDKLQGDKPWR